MINNNNSKKFVDSFDKYANANIRKSFADCMESENPFMLYNQTDVMIYGITAWQRNHRLQVYRKLLPVMSQIAFSSSRFNNESIKATKLVIILEEKILDILKKEEMCRVRNNKRYFK